MIAYFDCYSGISGDMILGALVDAGVPFDALVHELRRLPLGGYELERQEVSDTSIRGTKLRVRVPEPDLGHRHLSDIEALIADSSLSERVKERSLSVFRCLAEAEAAVHGSSRDEVHFHEVGAVDSIIDVVGSAIGLDWLGVQRVCASPLPLGSGVVTCDHGTLPVPAPATLELCRRARAPIRATDVEAELVTPTGAAIVCTLATFERPLLRLCRVGYGFGERRLVWPNALRLWLGDPVESGKDQDVVAVIETNVDDMTPELLGAAMDQLFEAGALDVSFEPIQMKKNRPAVKVTVIVKPEQADELAGLLLEHTTTLGVRVHEVRRLKCERWQARVQTPWGEVLVKFKRVGDRRLAAPEYEDCRRLARAAGVDLAEVYAAAKAAAASDIPLD